MHWETIGVWGGGEDPCPAGEVSQTIPIIQSWWAPHGAEEGRELESTTFWWNFESHFILRMKGVIQWVAVGWNIAVGSFDATQLAQGLLQCIRSLFSRRINIYWCVLAVLQTPASCSNLPKLFPFLQPSTLSSTLFPHQFQYQNIQFNFFHSSQEENYQVPILESSLKNPI